MKLFFGLSVALNLLEFITQREGSKSPRGTGQISGGGVQLLPEPQQGAPLRIRSVRSLALTRALTTALTSPLL